MDTQIVPVEALSIGAGELGIELSEGQLRDMERFVSLLLEWNEKFNLTRITDPHEIVVKHLLDSLTCLSTVRFAQAARVVDVGTGPGMPGIPLKIARPDLRMTLVDATRKKLTFVETVVRELGLDDVALVHARAEDAARNPALREKFDVVTARAVAEMQVLAEYTIPLAAVGGVVIAMKGPDVDQELAKAKRAIPTLGGELEKVARLTLPSSDAARSLVIIRKETATPKKYPRRQAEIAKKPL